MINTIKGKSKTRRVQINIPKKVWYFCMVWEDLIYYCTEGNYRRPALECLTCDTIDISEWLEFEFYDLVWFWNNQSYDTKPMLVMWLGVSHSFWSALCYCIICEKGNFLSRTTVQHPTTDETNLTQHSKMDPLLQCLNSSVREDRKRTQVTFRHDYYLWFYLSQGNMVIIGVTTH